MLRSPGFWRGPKGDAGNTGPQGPKGDKGDAGSTGSTGGAGATGATGAAGPAGATGAQGPKGDTGVAGPQGPTGPQGPAGAKAPTSDRLQLVGNVTISETLLISLSLGIQRKTATLSGIAVGDKLFFAPNGVPTAGCEAVNVYASATNQVTVSCFMPALGIGATYSIPISVYKVTT